MSPKWLAENVLPQVLSEIDAVTLISNRNDPQERSKTLRRLQQTPTFAVISIEAKHPWTTHEDAELRIPLLTKILAEEH